MGIVNPDDMNFVPKRWGYEQWICNNNKYCGKRLFLRQHKCCSYHMHRVKDETLYIDSGRIHMVFGSGEDFVNAVDTRSGIPPFGIRELTQGMAFQVKPGLYHQMYALEDTVILEFSTTHADEDSYRLTTENLAKGYWPGILDDIINSEER